MISLLLNSDTKFYCVYLLLAHMLYLQIVLSHFIIGFYTYFFTFLWETCTLCTITSMSMFSVSVMMPVIDTLTEKIYNEIVI